MDDIRLLLHHFGPYKKDAAVGALFVLLETTLELIIPILMSSIIDDGIMKRDMQLIFVRGALMFACAILALLFGLGYARSTARAAMGLGASLREAEFAYVQRFSFSNLDSFETSSLVTRMTSDVTVIQNALVASFRPMLRGPSLLVMGLLLACFMSVPLALIFCIGLPFMAVALFLVVRHVAPLYQVLQGVMDRLNDALEEDLTAIRAVKAYVREGYVAERFDEVNRDLATTATRTFRSAVLNTPIFQLSMYATCVGILWVGGNMILAGTLEVGTLTGFMTYVFQIVNSLMMISNVFLLMARAITSVHRVGEVLAEEPTLVSPEKALTEVPNGSVSFKDVSFKYRQDAEQNVLTDISFDIPAGSTVGILGGTGSGKSTLVQLIARLYDVSVGKVCVGGHDVRDYDLVDLRDAVGVVLQNNVLFTGTVRDNLLWGNPNASDEEMLHACHLACADEFLDRIGGLDGDLGQGGVNVSGGQKQRLCIARALLKRPKVLILDDSTSALDMATDARVRKNLESLGEITKIVIAQRVASVMQADEIVILDEGRVHATGTHEDLLAHDPIYQELYQSQIGSGIHGEAV